MPRSARIVVPGVPHHITQRGNRRLQTFFSDADYRRYLELIGDECAKAGVSVLADCPVRAEDLAENLVTGTLSPRNW
ncbi:MAG: hypothetical protein ABL898_05335 [Hyphomicrobiaceae bacterium]